MRKIIRNIYRRRKALRRIIMSNAYVVFTTETEHLEDGFLNSNVINKDVRKVCELLNRQMDFNDSEEGLNYVRELLDQRQPF